MAILVFSPNGTHVAKPTLEEARTSADCAGKTVVVTSALTAAQSDILAAWPADRALEVKKGGSISNSTAFTFATGAVITIPNNLYVFAGSGTVTGLKEARPEWFAASITDYAASFAACAASGAKLVSGTPGANYPTTQKIIPAIGQTWAGNGAKIIPHFAAQVGTNDVIYIPGNNSLGWESHDITVKGWIIDATGNTSGVGFGIQTLGRLGGFAYNPHDINLESNTTINCPSGGIFIASTSWVNVVGNKNDGGNRGVGTFSPIANPVDTHHITITGNQNKNTTQYGIQTYYGFAISIIGNILEGSVLQVAGDKSNITVDRSYAVTVSGNIARNAPWDQIYITGSRDVTVTGNTTDGGLGGIQANGNLEYIEDPAIHESQNITVTGNVCNFHTERPIIFNGVNGGSITGNTVRGGSSRSITVMDSTRVGDGFLFATNNISIIGNQGTGEYYQAAFNGTISTISMLGNSFSAFTGVTTSQLVLNSIGNLAFGNRDLYNYGILRKTDQGSSFWLQQVSLADESYHKGFHTSYDYGQMTFTDSAGGAAFSLDIGGGANKKDFNVLKAGAGIVVKSPDGLVTKRIGIDNAGAIQITIP